MTNPALHDSGRPTTVLTVHKTPLGFIPLVLSVAAAAPVFILEF